MKRVTILDLQKIKDCGEKITMLTAYDYPTARMLDEAGVDILLIGDSVGNVMMGYENTLLVTVDDIIYHTKAVAKARKKALVVADMPFMSYQVSIEEARINAGRMIQEGGAEAVKLEGGENRSFEQGVWSKRSPAERKQVLLKLADLLEENLAEIALLDCLDAGKPITDCMTIDAPDTVHCFRWHAEAIDKEYEQVAPTGPGNVAMVVREPLGVIGAILPWNFPIQMGAWKLGPILATGNSVVVKPARQTSLSILRLAELAAEAGIPEGVLNIIPGNGGVIGAALCKHMDVDAAAFTGSTEVGRQLLHYSAESNLKRRRRAGRCAR